MLHTRSIFLSILCMFFAYGIWLTAFGQTSNTLNSDNPLGLDVESSAHVIDANPQKSITPEDVVTFEAVDSQKKPVLGEDVFIAFRLITQKSFKLYVKGLKFFTRSADPASIEQLLSYTANPSAVEHYDRWYKENRSVFFTGTIFNLKIPAQTAADVKEIFVKFQACSGSHCLLPTTFSLLILKNQTAEVTSVVRESAVQQNSVGLSDSLLLKLRRALADGSALIFVLLFFGGLLMNATPCVYPMIPITLNVLGGFGAKQFKKNLASSRRMLAFIYALGIVLTYSGMGVVAALTGNIFGSLLQNQVFLASVALIFFIFGIFTLLGDRFTLMQTLAAKIPLTSKFPAFTAFAMGGLSGLVAAPCTGPILSTILLIISTTRNGLYGFTLMLFFSVGFAFPYFVLGVFAQKIVKLPKIQKYFNFIKIIFSSFMFSLSLYFLKSIFVQIPWTRFIYTESTFTWAKEFLMLLLLVFIAAAFVLMFKAKHVASFLAKVVMIVIITAVSLWGALWVTHGFVSTEKLTLQNDLVFEKKASAASIHWITDWDKAKELAKTSGKPLIVDIWAEWCAACLQMDQELWTDTDIVTLIEHQFIAVKLNFTESSTLYDQIVLKWQLAGLPAVGIFSHGDDFEKVPHILFRAAVDKTTLLNAIKSQTHN